MPGYIYLLSNPSMPGLLKIGHTMDLPEQRLRQLNTTGVPLPFILEACFLVDDPESLERAVHTALTPHRPVQNREFFNLSPSQALKLILPLVVQAAGAASTEPPKVIHKDHGFSDSEILLLQLLVSAGSHYGMARWRLKDRIGADDLDVEIAIANLVAKKLVTRSRESDSYGPVWLPTPKGTKFLLDNGLIEEWMRQGW
ncbi:GIY-YIG nuclease family protein [Pseudomonas aeruginosa]